MRETMCKSEVIMWLDSLVSQSTPYVLVKAPEQRCARFDQVGDGPTGRVSILADTKPSRSDRRRLLESVLDIMAMGAWRWVAESEMQQSRAWKLSVSDRKQSTGDDAASRSRRASVGRQGAGRLQ